MGKSTNIQFDSEEEYIKVKEFAKAHDTDVAKFTRSAIREKMDRLSKQNDTKEPEVKQEAKQEVKPVITNSVINSTSTGTTSGTGTFPIDIPKKEIKQPPIVKERKKRMEEADKEEFRKMIREESTKVYNKKDDEKSLNSKLDKIYEKQCQGEECIKNLEKAHTHLKSEVASIREEEPCIGCSSKVRVGSSYCPSCGLKITGWSQLPDWKPSWRK